MSNAYEIYVISNSDLFRESLNAVSAFCNSGAFKSATYIGAAIGIVMSAVAYLKNHDVMVFLKWFAMYFFVFNILLGVKLDVVIVNTSDSSVPGYFVDNVPIGIALPAHLITSMGQGFSSDLEVAFHMPNVLQYNKTGMLFGSNLFRLSLASQIDDPELMNQMNAYVRSCVVGDMLINHKYSMNDLLHSKDIWALMSSNPSPIRGIFVDGQFQTCRQATANLTSQLNNFAGQRAPGILAKFLPSHRVYQTAAFNDLLMESYQGLRGLSDTAANILRQNLAINAFRSGIKNYAAETGSVAGMQNYANTTAMMNTRMAWSTSSHIGIQTLPLMQVVLLMMMLCLFPLIAILCVIPGFGGSVFKNYLYTLIWLESWPIMFTVLNLAMTFYISHGHNVQHVTLSNINRLAQEQSDIAGIAGYLILAIPFLSIGLVKGMAMTFNQAAQYIGGMMHSIGQGVSSSVAMGNYSMGNVSTANATANSIQANKHDTNFTDMHGQTTEQLVNASTITHAASGDTVSNVGGAMSHLATNINASSAISSALTKSAEHYRSEADSHRQSVDQAISSATSNAMAYDSATTHGKSLSDSSNLGENTQVDKAVSHMMSIAKDYAKREGGTVSDAFNRLTQESINETGGFDSSKAAIGAGVKLVSGLSASVSGTGTQQAGSINNTSYQNIAENQAHQNNVDDFKKSMHIVENYSRQQNASHQQSQSNSIAEKIGADFRRAESATQSEMADLTKGERLAQQASYVSSHSESIQSNYNQAFAEHIRRVAPDKANEILNNTSSLSIAMQRQSLEENFLNKYTKELENGYLKGASTVNPENRYTEASGKLSAAEDHANQHYLKNSHAVKNQTERRVGGFDDARYKSIQSEVENQYGKLGVNIDEQEKHIQHEREQSEHNNQTVIGADKESAQKGVLHHDVSYAYKGIKGVGSFVYRHTK